MRRAATRSLAVLAAALGGCGGAMGETSKVEVQWQFGGLVALPAIAALPEHTVIPYAGYPGSSFYLGAVVDDADWQNFASAALVENAPSIAGGQAVLFAVFDARTNTLAPNKVERRDDTLIYTLDWDGIEPYYTNQTPAALALVDRTGITGVKVRARAGEVGSFPMP